MASISWEQERLLVTEVTNLIDIFNDGKASDRNQMVIVGFLQLRQKETQDTAAGTRMLRRRPTNCRRKTDLGAISQPPYFFAPDYVSKFIRLGQTAPGILLRSWARGETT